MRLAVSHAAAPEARVSRLCALALERGLDGVELLEPDLADAAALERAVGFVVALRLESLGAIASPRTARIAAALGAPVVAARGVVDRAAVSELDAIYRAAQAHLCVTHGTSVEEAVTLAEALADAPSLSLAWEIDTRRDDLREGPALLLAAGSAIDYVRMRGGGPELGDEGSAGTGELVSSLAFSGYASVVTLAPTDDRRLADWGAWLAGRVKNGCGTAYEKKTRARAADLDLDIRPVEPRHRMETILGAYRSLAPGRTLHVTFDHDPSCMDYTLRATEPEGSFVFERTADGPDVWRADVTKRA